MLLIAIDGFEHITEDDGTKLFLHLLVSDQLPPNVRLVPTPHAYMPHIL